MHAAAPNARAGAPDEARAVTRLGHHDLCFGCGLANVFGLHLELERAPDGGVVGRFFVKQDHQGPPGAAHPGVVAAALQEALALAGGAYPEHMRIDRLGAAPVGTFVEVRADGGHARATGEEGVIAEGHVLTDVAASG